MFEFIRTHTRLALGFMLLLIIPSFVFFGVQGYSRFNDSTNDTVAKVGGQAITRLEWDEAYKRYVDMVRSRAPNLDPSVLDTPKARRDALDNVIRERVLLAAASDLHLFPSDARMARIFDSDPQYAGLRGPDGRISRERLVALGLTPALFDQRLRQEIGVRQVMGGIVQTVPPVALPASAALDAFLERRAVQMQRFDPVAYRDKIKPGETDIEAYFKAHEAQFRAPEQAQIEYVELDLNNLAKGVNVSDADLLKAYDEAKPRYTEAEERRASHILVAADKEKPAAERAKAKAKAEALLAEVRKNPASFGEVARKNSDDPGSAANGGDLDFHPRGDMVPPFDDAMFKLKQGEISDVVETDFGYHVIKLTALRGGTTKPFEAVRAEVEAEARKAAAQRRWAEAAETFTNTAYEQSDSLQPLIDKLKLQKKTATVQRTVAPGATGPLASAKLLDAVFGNDAVQNKRNTDAVEVAPNQLVAARVLQHQPARTLPLAEVQDRVRAAVVEEQAAALARKEGQARLEALRAGTSTEPLPTSVVASRAQSQALSGPLLDAALRADATKLPVLTGVDLGAQGYVVMRVMQVLPMEAPPGGVDELRKQYAQVWASAEAEAYMEGLKRRYKTQITPAAALPADAASAPLR